MFPALFQPFFGKYVNLMPGEAEKGEMGEMGSARTAPKGPPFELFAPASEDTLGEHAR